MLFTLLEISKETKVGCREISAVSSFSDSPVVSSSLSESPFKVHLEKLGLRKRKLDEDLQLYQTPLELKLKHSTVHVDELCPLVVPNPGVSVIHDYADWVKEAPRDLPEVQSEYILCPRSQVDSSVFLGGCISSQG